MDSNVLPPIPDAPVGLLLSGGLDSGILLCELLRQQRSVQPFYVQSHLHWEAAELAATRRLLDACPPASLRPLVVLEMPTADLYGRHWSVTGDNVPDSCSDDAAVFLPGRNALLIMKAALWCQMQGIPQLALAPLKSNPFPDATVRFFQALELTLELATGSRIQIWRPFAEFEKGQVMELGRGFRLELTFSCIDPVEGLHCGRCNKCHERQQAFAENGMVDRTPYAGEAAHAARPPDPKAPACFE